MSRPLLRRVLFVVVALALLGLTWSGLHGAVDEWGHSRTFGQIVQTVTQFAFGLFALLTLVTTIRGRRWNSAMSAGLIVSLGLSGGLGAVVWGDASVLIGLIAALASAAIGLGIVWLARVASPAEPGQS